MAAAKKRNNRKGSGRSSSRGSSGRRGTSAKRQENSGFGTEILLLVILAASILMILGNLGIGGAAGEVVSAVLFGVMGLMAYVFPIVLFLGSVFLISNRQNPLVYKKLLALIIFLAVLCGLLQLLTEGYMKSTTLSDYYSLCSGYRTGGGVIGGAVCISTASAFGVAGGCVIMVLVLMISLIIITQRSFFDFIFRLWDGLCGLVRGGHERYMEGQPERELKKELKQKERRERREIRQAERLKELEAALAEDEEEAYEKKKNSRKKKAAPEENQAKVRQNRSDRKSENGRDKEAHQNPVIGTPSFLRGIMNSMPSEEAIEAENNGISGDTLSAASPEEDSSGQLKFRIQRSEPEDYEDIEDNPEEKSASVPGQRSENEPLYSDNPLPASGAGDVFFGEKGTASEEVFPSEMQRNTSAESGNLGSAPQNSKNTGLRKTASRAEETEGLPAADGEDTDKAISASASSKPVHNPKSSQKEIESGIHNIQKEITQQAKVKQEYHYPPLKLLKRGSGKSQGDSDAHLRKTAQKLQDTLHNFGVNVTVTNVSCGPTVTRYELQPEQGVKVSRIVNLADDIKLNLATPDIRIEAPIPGKAAVGIEVPNKENHAVMLREILQSQEFQTAKSKLAFAVGKDIGGKPVVADIAKMPHLLIAGATGSGKSVCINTLIVSLLYKASPEDVKLIMIDPKVVELSVYNGIPHLFIPVVTDPKKAAGALNWAVTEMMGRYNTFAEYNVRNLEEYNRKVEGMRIPEGEEPPEKMPQIVIIVDELADLMMVAPGEVEDAICRLAQLARAAGIHLIIATQRPSVNVITGLIKANMPSRIAFSVSSGVDSRTILDMNGAEKLLGKGDMLFYPQGYQKPARLQGAFVSDEEVSAIVEFLANKNPAVEYNPQIEQSVNTGAFSGGASGGEERDAYFAEAGKFIIEKEKASIGMLQRMFKIGFNRAARIMDQLCDAGVVGPEEGTKPRKVLMTMEEFEKYIEEVL